MNYCRTVSENISQHQITLTETQDEIRQWSVCVQCAGVSGEHDLPAGARHHEARHPAHADRARPHTGPGVTRTR